MLITSSQERSGNKIAGFCHAECISPKWSIKRHTQLIQVAGGDADSEMKTGK